MDYFPVTYFYLTSLCPDLDTEKHLGFIFCTQQHLAVATYRKLWGTRFRFDLLAQLNKPRAAAALLGWGGLATGGGNRWFDQVTQSGLQVVFYLPSQMFVWCCFSLAFKDTGNQFFTVGWAAFMPKTAVMKSCSCCTPGVQVGGLHVINMTGHMQLQLPLHMVGCILMDSLVFTRQCQRGV